MPLMALLVCYFCYDYLIFVLQFCNIPFFFFIY